MSSIINNEILDTLNNIPNERRKILFGDLARFSSWLKEKGIISDVSKNFEIFILIN